MGDLLAAGVALADIALVLGRSLNAVTIRRARFFPRVQREMPAWKGSPLGNQRWWTPERIAAGLVDFAAKHPGRLPNSDHEYNRLKKEHMEWPPAQRVLALHGCMANAWDSLSVHRSRVTRQWAPWTQADDDYLLERAGEETLKRVALHLGRSWGACKRRLYDLGAGRARDVSGHLSAMQVAKLYNCPLARVKRLIATGGLSAVRVKGGHYWRIEPEDCERLKDTLSAPKRHSYKGSAPDVGNYEQRYGLKRVTRDGKVVRVARRDADGIHVPLTRFHPVERRFAATGGGS